MAKLGDFVIEYDGQTRTIEWLRIDYIYFEDAFGRSSTGTMRDQFGMGWVALKRTGVTVPDFEEFLKQSPDVDLRTEDDAGKDGGKTDDPSTTG